MLAERETQDVSELDIGSDYGPVFAYSAFEYIFVRPTAQADITNVNDVNTRRPQVARE